MFEGIVISESVRGTSWVEQDETHTSVFCHISHVAGNRVLHVGDRVRFTITENPNRPGKMMADNVTYVGHVIARQTSGNGGVR